MSVKEFCNSVDICRVTTKRWVSGLFGDSVCVSCREWDVCVLVVLCVTATTQSHCRVSSRLLNGRTRTATFTDDMLVTSRGTWPDPRDHLHGKQTTSDQPSAAAATRTVSSSSSSSSRRRRRRISTPATRWWRTATDAGCCTVPPDSAIIPRRGSAIRPGSSLQRRRATTRADTATPEEEAWSATRRRPLPVERPSSTAPSPASPPTRPWTTRPRRPRWVSPHCRSRRQPPATPSTTTDSRPSACSCYLMHRRTGRYRRSRREISDIAKTSGRYRAETINHAQTSDTNPNHKNFSHTNNGHSQPEINVQQIGIGNENDPIRLAQRWFPGLAISSDKIYIYFSHKIHGSNFIKEHSETVMVWNYRNADCSLKNLLCYLL